MQAALERVAGPALLPPVKAIGKSKGKGRGKGKGKGKGRAVGGEGSGGVVKSQGEDVAEVEAKVKLEVGNTKVTGSGTAVAKGQGQKGQKGGQKGLITSFFAATASSKPVRINEGMGLSGQSSNPDGFIGVYRDAGKGKWLGPI